VTPALPGYDEVVLTAPDSAQLCYSLACARAGRAAEVVVTFGTLNDPRASLYARTALWREIWHTPLPMCGGCWDSSHQIAMKYRPGLAVIDATSPAAAEPSRGRA
jgi:hypothetical protein